MKNFILNWLPNYSRCSPYLEKYSVEIDGKRISENEGVKRSVWKELKTLSQS
jgi:hypothetical protein